MQADECQDSQHYTEKPCLKSKQNKYAFSLSLKATLVFYSLNTVQKSKVSSQFLDSRQSLYCEPLLKIKHNIDAPPKKQYRMNIPISKSDSIDTGRKDNINTRPKPSKSSTMPQAQHLGLY